MKLHHIAIWTFRLEELKEFYVRFFGGKSNEKYINPKKGFESYFVSFGEGTDLELMSRTDVQNTPIEENRIGLTHFAFTFPSQEEVLRFTEQMRLHFFGWFLDSSNQFLCVPHSDLRKIQSAFSLPALSDRKEMHLPIAYGNPVLQVHSANLACRPSPGKILQIPG